jgi:hypothetical protein
MKNKFLFLATLAAVLMFGFTSCSDDENLAPTFKSASISTDNKTITVNFSEAVYSQSSKSGNLDSTKLLVTAPEGVEFTYNVTHSAGSSVAMINIAITSVVQGTEVFTIKPASGSAIYDEEGSAMSASEVVKSNALTKDLGIIGTWLSEGDNVAPLLVTYFNVAKVTADFKADYTYVVNQFNTGNTTTTPDLVFSGTYEIEKSNVGNIWTITCNQELPYAAVASGIFEVKTGPEVLWYEVAQTTGTQNVPPTPAGGFGSTNGGTLGVMNVQKYVRQ